MRMILMEIPLAMCVCVGVGVRHGAQIAIEGNQVARLAALRDKLLRKLEDTQLAADLARIKYEAAEQQLAAMEQSIHRKSPI